MDNLCYKAADIPMAAGEVFLFCFWVPGLASISVLEQKYVQEINRVYNINKWSYVQVVSQRSLYKNELREMTGIAVGNRGWKKR